MLAEVIAIGDELTSGERLDTNSQWLSQRLAELGIRVLYHTTVGDDLAANVAVFRNAVERADIIVCSGGLGPTADDLTRQAWADAVGVPLLLFPEALAHIEALFARRQRPMPERNRVQALFPEGSRVIPNPHGSAPGIDLDIARPERQSSRVFALPGVPAEMYEMWHGTVGPAIASVLGSNRTFLKSRTIRCFGVGESDLEAMLPDLIRRGRQPTVGITVSQATISLRVVAEGRSDVECDTLIAPTVDTICQCLGKLIFGEGEDELPDAVIRLLLERKQTLAVAECGTGGLIANWLSERDPHGQVFLGGEILRSAQIHDDVRAEEHAELIRRRFKTDLGLSVGAFPAADSSSSQTGRVAIGLAGLDDQPTSTSCPFSGHPDILKPRSAKQALNALRLRMLGE